MDETEDLTQQPLIDAETARKVVAMGFEPGDHISKAYALAKLASGGQVADGQAPSNVDMNVRTPGMVGQVLAQAGVAPTLPFSARAGDSDQNTLGSGESGSNDSRPTEIAAIGPGARRINRYPWLAAPESIPGLKAGFHIDPTLQPCIDEMRQKSPSFDTQMRDVEESTKKSGNAYYVLAGTLPEQKPGDIGPAYTYPDIGHRGAITLIDPDQVPKFNYMVERGGVAQMSLQRAIAHELSYSAHYEHALFPGLTTEHSIIGNENQIMDEFDQSPHRDRDDPRITRRLGGSNG
jgi:hypothetical protein